MTKLIEIPFDANLIGQEELGTLMKNYYKSF
jgi:hypothetical protein